MINETLKKALHNKWISFYDYRVLFKYIRRIRTTFKFARVMHLCVLSLLPHFTVDHEIAFMKSKFDPHISYQLKHDFPRLYLVGNKCCTCASGHEHQSSRVDSITELLAISDVFSLRSRLLYWIYYKIVSLLYTSIMNSWCRTRYRSWHRLRTLEALW